MVTKHRRLPVLFCLLFVAVGLAVMAVGVRHAVQARKTLEWPTTSGRVLQAGVRSEQIKSRDDQRRERRSTYYYADVEYEYEVEGKRYVGTRITFSEGQSGSAADAQATVGRYPTGTQVKVAYDPDAPEQSVLEPGKWGNAGWLLLFGGLFSGIPGLMAYSMLQQPQAEPVDDTIASRTLGEVLFKERILEWQPGTRIHLHRAPETWLTTIVGSVFGGFLLGLIIMIFLAGFIFSHFGLAFVIKSYVILSTVLAAGIAIAFAMAHRLRDTIIDWNSSNIRAQVGLTVRQYPLNQIEGLACRYPGNDNAGDAARKLSTKVELNVDGRAYVLLETEHTRRQAEQVRKKLRAVLITLAEQLGVPWAEEENESPFSRFFSRPPIRNSERKEQS
ncbi:MAG: DUF3592 domain-containing protein [bacterium]|nr:DUF3592 domain-containing protein [bacterium]